MQKEEFKSFLDSSFFIMKKKSKKQLKRKCDKLWSEIIKQKGCCEVCGRRTSLNAHHVVGRINYVLRWDLRNGVCLCVLCHKFSRNSAHNNPLWFSEWFKKNRPEDYRYLQGKRNEIKTFYLSDYEEIYENLLRVRDEIQKKACGF